MFKKVLIAILSVVLAVCALAMTACFGGHSHTFSSTWETDETHHWHPATCGCEDLVGSRSEHTFRGGVICAECGYEAHYSVGLTYAIEEGEYIVTGRGSSTAIDLVIPDAINGIAVTGVADDAFYDCNDIESISFGKNVTSIGKNAFYRCTAVQGIEFGSGVKYIGENAFYGCISLVNLVFGTNVEVVEDGAFGNCITLSGVIVNDNIKYVGSNVFYNCPSIQYYPAGEAKYLSSDTNPNAILVSLSNTAATACTVADGTKVIAGYAFENASALTRVILPVSLISIGDYAFFGCEVLDQVVVPDAVEYIGDSAFFGCLDMKEITIGSSVKMIEQNAFQNCAALQKVYFSGTIDEWVSIDFVLEEDAAQNYANPLCYATSLLINSAEITGVAIMEATEIKDYAFYNYKKLARVTLGDSVTKIGNYAFYGCTALSTISIPDTIRSVASSAFTNCTALTYNIDENGKYLGNETNKYVVLIGVIDATATTLAINRTTKIIGDEAFFGYAMLENIVIPESVVSIGSRAFYFAQINGAILFENTQGWKAGDVIISERDLSNDNTKIFFLTDLYSDGVVWTRG